MVIILVLRGSPCPGLGRLDERVRALRVSPLLMRLSCQPTIPSQCDSTSQKRGNLRHLDDYRQEVRPGH